MVLVDSLKRAHKKDWSEIIDNVPIFCQHKWFERDVDGGKEARTVLPGEEPPPAKDGWKFIYEVTEDDLKNVCEEVNKNFEKYATPMKIQVGHSKPGRPQEEQPRRVGFAINARMGTFGPKSIPAVLAKTFYQKGCEEVAKDYPQRSVEFKQSTGAITGIALLKTDPRLPLGFHAYGSEKDLYFYGVGEMAEEKEEKKEHEGDKPPVKPTEPVAATKPPMEKPAAAPVEKPQAAPLHDPNEISALEPHEQHFANRLMKHYAETCAPMKYLHEQHKKYAETQATMAAASPTNGKTPASPVGAEAKPHEPAPASEEYMDTEEKRQYEENQAFLMQENARLYADQRYMELVALGVKKSSLGKFKDKIVKMRLDAKTNAEREAACKEYLEEIKQNYGREARPPLARDFLPIPHENAAEAPRGSSEIVQLTEEDTAAVTRYAEQQKINILDEDGIGWQQALNGYMEMKKKKDERKTA